jgi:hypothetical protein
MFNMINLALKDLPVRVIPSRSTNTLYGWLDERCVNSDVQRPPSPFPRRLLIDRERTVYSQMKGYEPSMRETVDIFSLRVSAIPCGRKAERFTTLPRRNRSQCRRD